MIQMSSGLWSASVTLVRNQQWVFVSAIRDGAYFCFAYIAITFEYSEGEIMDQMSRVGKWTCLFSVSIHIDFSAPAEESSDNSNSCVLES